MAIIESVCYPGTTDPVMEGDLVQGIGWDDGLNINKKKGVLHGELRYDFGDRDKPFFKVHFNKPFKDPYMEEITTIWNCYIKNLKLLKRKEG